MGKPSNDELGKVFTAFQVLGQFVSQGKRSPAWVCARIQDMLDYREDGTRYVEYTKEILDLGSLEVCYDLTPDEMIRGNICTPPYFQGFKNCQWAYDSRIYSVKLAAVRYRFNHGSTAADVGLDEIRVMLRKDGYLPAQLPELAACYQQKSEFLRSNKVGHLLALGVGISAAGTSDDRPHVFEHVPAIDGFPGTNIMSTEMVMSNHRSDNWYLVRGE